MADEDQDTSAPNLEPPKLFGRKKTPEPTPDTEPVEEVSDVEDEPTAVLPVSDPTWMFEPPAEVEPEPLPEPFTESAAEPATEPIAQPVDSVLPAEIETPLFADEVEDGPAPTKVRKQREPRAKKQKQPKAKRPRRLRAAPSSLPTMTGWVAAAVTGVVIGLLLVGLTAGSLQTCESVRGTSTCGGSGVPILLVIMAALVALGGYVLRIFRVPDPTSTSFLAVGMIAVISLLFLLDVLLSLWMFLVIPVISAAMYLLAYWVTTAFVEPAKEPAEKRAGSTNS